MEDIIKKKSFIKKEINIINFFLNYIQNNYKSKEIQLILSFLSNEKKSYDFFIKKKNKLEKLYIYLEKSCDHEFIEDYIDIDPEISHKIIYCYKCEYTKTSIY